MKHLDEVGETYWQHFKFAAGMGLLLFITGILVLIHAVFPDILKNVGSDAIQHVSNILEERKVDDD